MTLTYESTVFFILFCGNFVKLARESQNYYLKGCYFNNVHCKHFKTLITIIVLSMYIVMYCILTSASGCNLCNKQIIIIIIIIINKPQFY